MAELANDPDIRRRHEKLANLHPGRAALHGIGGPGAHIQRNLEASGSFLLRRLRF